MLTSEEEATLRRLKRFAERNNLVLLNVRGSLYDRVSDLCNSLSLYLPLPPVRGKKDTTEAFTIIFTFLNSLRARTVWTLFRFAWTSSIRLCIALNASGGSNPEEQMA